ncbi:MAG TPA: two-component regulator propeller domain-containing protein, partial [Sphingobacteriaceae bacterium]
MRLYEPFYKFCFCLLFLIAQVRYAGGQTLNFKQLTVNDGLLSSTIYFTYQDSRGFMWFATESGINRYDGSKFESFSIEDGLSDNEVLWIQEDSQGRIWFLTLNGQLCYYFQNRFHNPSNNELLRKASPKASLISFFEDSRKQIWVCTTQQEIVLIGENFVQFYKLPAKYFVANSFVTEDRNGKIWILNDRNAFSVAGKKLIQEKIDDYPVSPKSFYTDRASGRTLFISSKGLVEFINGRTRLVQPLEPAIIKQGLGHFFIDDDNSIWVSTMGNGISRFNKQRRTNNYLPGRYVSHTIKDRSGNIWISTIGDGVYFLSENTKNIAQYTERFGLSDAAVHSIARDGNGQFWLGLRNGGVNFLQGSVNSFKDLRITANPYNPIKILTPDSARRSMWFATNNSLGEIRQDLSASRYLRESDDEIFAIKSFSLSRNGQLAFALASGVYVLPDKNGPLVFHAGKDLPGRQKFFPLRAFTVFFDSANTLWFSNIKGLFKYRNDTLTDYSTLSPVLTKRITDIKELPDGTMAFATYGYGVLLVRDHRILHHFTARKGLVSNIVTRLKVRSGYLWAGTN